MMRDAMSESGSGVLKLTTGGNGVLYDPEPASGEVCVPAHLIRAHYLGAGAAIAGPLREGQHGLELAAVTSVCGLTPEAFQARTPFAQLVAVSPCERFHLAASGEKGMRIVDLVAPIGKGTRGLIVSPPKAGKTMLLEQIAGAIRADEPDARIIVLLIDERPEEVTHFRRTVSAQVFASSSDQNVQEHVALTELMLAHIRTELECGHDVVVLVDSFTRLIRAFNRRGKGAGRTLSGGLDAGALEIPRRFFGLARNVEDGGSVTLLATLLVDTGSRMDQVIYEELKGTGNSEIVLDRALAEARLFPAINLAASGTRKIENLYGPDDVLRITKLRRVLAERSPKRALSQLLQLLEGYPTNEAFLQVIPLDQ
jgi:transcription termination factor Rho